MQSVVVTGVSTGIGWGIAKVMTARGFRVFGSVRKPADAERLRAELGERLSPLLFDVTDEAAVARGAAEVGAALGDGRLLGLVNNAGIAVAGPLLEASADDFRHQLEVNLIAPMTVIKAFAPLLGTDRARTGPPGRIVNISSVGGRFAAPVCGPLCGLQARTRGPVAEPAAGTDAVRNRRDYRGARIGRDSDLGQGRAN